jgi:hypothetical protein
MLSTALLNMLFNYNKAPINLDVTARNATMTKLGNYLDTRHTHSLHYRLVIFKLITTKY